MVNHDGCYKNFFSHAIMVEDLLKGFVREDWVAELDFSSLEKVNGSYVSDDLRNRADDVVWRVRWGREWLYIYIIMEFQSTVDPWMAVRMMTYVGLLYQDLIRADQLSDRKKLPPVLPLVLYNGDSSWTAATDVAQLVEEVPGVLGKYCPRLPYLLLVEHEYEEEELCELKNLVAVLFRSENSRDPAQLYEIVTHLVEWLAGPQQASLRRAFTVWFKKVLLPSRFDEKDQPVIEDLEEVKTMLAERVKEWNKKSLEKGLRQGRQEGRQEGRKEGLQQGIKQLLTRQLEKKFGKLDAQIISLLEGAEEKELVDWSIRILTADSLDDIFI